MEQIGIEGSWQERKKKHKAKDVTIKERRKK